MPRKWVCDARQENMGIFAGQSELILHPFELRFLGRRRPPGRWVVDLSKNDNVLIKSQDHYTVPNVEDRLFVPDEFVPLLVELGWQREE